MIKFTATVPAVLDAVPDALITVDQQGNIVYFNAQAEKLFGYLREELLGQNMELLMPERFRHHHATLRFKYFERPHVRPPLGEGLELYGLKKDGSEFPIEVSLSPLINGTELLALASIRDIAARKKSEEKIKKILEGIPDAVVIINQENKIILVNVQAERFFGYNHQEFLGLSMEQLMPERYRQTHQGRQSWYFQNPHIMRIGTGLELCGLRKDGSEFPIEIYLNPIEVEEGLWLLTAIHDITERKQFEQNLSEKNIALQRTLEGLERQTEERLQAEKKLAEYQLLEQKTRAQVAEEYQKRQEEFINTICHELRNPLNIIQGEIDLLTEKIFTIEKLIKLNAELLPVKTCSIFNETLSNCREDLEVMEECSQQQKHIVDEVLDFSKLENNKVELNPIIFNLQKAVHNTLQMFTPQLKEKHLSIQLKMPKKEVWLKADVYRLKQIIINLLTNAIKFTAEGGISINIHCRCLYNRDVMLYVSVKDTGIGMTAEESSHLFEPFSQANQQIVTQYGGSGLGLAICKKIIEKMEGKIQVESQKGQGSCFSFMVKCFSPLEEDFKCKEEKVTCQQPVSESVSSIENSAVVCKNEKKNILIVEDNKLNRKILEKYLKMESYNYQAAVNGLEAIELCKKFKFDLILMDIEMPIMNGLKASQEIRCQEGGLNQETPIIGLSGIAFSEQIELAKKAGMNDYLTKPYLKQQLYALIEKYIVFSSLLATREKKAPFRQAKFRYKETEALRLNVQTLFNHPLSYLIKPPVNSFFRNLYNNDCIIENRHVDAHIQREYDKRYGLMLK